MPKIAGIQSVTIGRHTVTFLPDGGGIVNPTALYPASSTADWQRYPELLDDDGQFITTIGAFLIRSGDRLIAVDLGIGPVSIPFPGFGPFSGGQYLESVAAIGVERHAVTDVFFTHLHLDHCGWTTIDEIGARVLTYPNARYHVSKVEWDFWAGGDNPAGPDPVAVQKPLAERIQFIAGGAALAPGITVLSTPGHTPGHLSLRLDGDEQRLYLTGDLLHGVMQLREPDWSVAFDADPVQARATREAMYPLLTQPDTIVAVNHFSNAVFGRMRAAAGLVAWDPILD